MLNVYIISSWHDWAYGIAFGHRAFVDSLPIFALALGAFYHAAKDSARHIRYAIGGLTALLIAVSLIQMFQHWLMILPWYGISSWDEYWSIFLTLS